MSIPPKGWGAVESLIYEYDKELTRLGHQVLVVNTKSRKKIINQVNAFNPDFVHCQYDEFVDVLKYINCEYKAITSHYGYLDQVWSHNDYLLNIHKKIVAEKNIYIFALSPSIAKCYIDDGVDPSRVKVIPNGVNFSLFNRSRSPKYPNKSIYLAKIDSRKRQGLVQKLDSDIDFAGNLCSTTAIASGFNPNKSTYLGEWSKDQVHSHLTEYANLVLLSDGEAHPLVCLEALASGLGLVISEFATANLDLSLPFIDVIPEHKISDQEFLADVIKNNRKKSLAARSEIESYAKTFDWPIVVDKYLEIVQTIVNDDIKLAKAPSIGVITVATGRYYEKFIPDLKKSIDLFLKIEGHNINFYCFTDHEEITSDITKFPARYIGWPFDTLLRYAMIKDKLPELMKNDYLLYVDSDMELVAAVNPEIFTGSLIAVQHPGFINKKGLIGTYEIEPDESSYVPPENRKTYFQGCFWGGQSVNFKKMILSLSDLVDQDLVKGLVPVWHDESYLNAYLSKESVVTLPPSYAYPEGAQFDFKPVVLHKNKPHNQIRAISANKLPDSSAILAGLAIEEKEYLYRNLYLKAHEKNQRLEWQLQKAYFYKFIFDKYFLLIFKRISDVSAYKKILRAFYRKCIRGIYG